MSPASRPPPEQWSLQVFHDYVDRVLAIVIKCLNTGSNFDNQLGRETCCIYLKSGDCRLVYSNESYQSVFSVGALPLGRVADSYLHESIVPIAKSSDQMIFAGSQRVSYDHFGGDSMGRSVLFRSEKRSLLGCGHPTFAILGVTRVQLVVREEQKPYRKIAFLTDRWNQFQNLDFKDQEIAIALAQGNSTSDIARELDVSKRTIENRRNTILELLDVDSQVALIKLLVRLQDNGFGEFGV